MKENPAIKDNPDWKPFIEAVSITSREHSNLALLDFMHGYPPDLWVTVALALSLVKWWMITKDRKQNVVRADKLSSYNCGCCVLFTQGGWGSCRKCPFGPKWAGCVVDRNNSEIYALILRVYTKHFNALPKKDKQKLAA